MFSNLFKIGTSSAGYSAIKPTLKCLTFLAACAAISTLAVARSGTSDIEHVFSKYIVQVENSEHMFVGMIECTTGEPRSCTALTTSGDRYLDQSELNWLLKFGGPK